MLGFLIASSQFGVFPARSIILLLVPPHTIFKLHTRATKDIERTANRQVDLAVTELLHELQVLD
jgi:hypothetical protein